MKKNIFDYKIIKINMKVYLSDIKKQPIISPFPSFVTNTLSILNI